MDYMPDNQELNLSLFGSVLKTIPLLQFPLAKYATRKLMSRVPLYDCSDTRQINNVNANSKEHVRGK